MSTSPTLEEDVDVGHDFATNIKAQLHELSDGSAVCHRVWRLEGRR